MIRTCKICGKEFTTKSHNATVCTNCRNGKCIICGKEFVRDWPYTQKVCKNSSCRSKWSRLQNTLNTTKICPLCGKEFVPKSPRQTFCEGPHYKFCEVCGKQFTLMTPTSRTRTCGSKECKQKIRESTNLDRFGVKNVMQSPEILEQYSKSMEEKYGKSWYLQTEEFWDKYRATMTKRYGVPYSFMSSEIVEKFKATMLERYGGEYCMSSKQLQSKASSTMQEKFGVPYFCMTDDYHKYQRHLISDINKKFSNQLDELGIVHTLEKRIENRQYDICIESKRILIEIDPSITHNSLFSIFDKDSNGLNQNYHRDKSILASKYGYRCIHVFDWDDWNKVLNMVKYHQIIYARNLEVRCVNLQDAVEFEILNHLQGSCKNQKFRLGLYDSSSKLIQLMTFGKPRYSSKYGVELLRLCTDSDYAVIGGANKLFHHFIKNHVYDVDLKSIVSYCDLSKFSGNVYEKMGMRLDHVSPPAKVWSKKSDMVRDTLLRQRGYDQLFGTEYGKGTNNEELMVQNNWVPVYDCGQNVYVWNNPIKD